MLIQIIGCEPVSKKKPKTLFEHLGLKSNRKGVLTQNKKFLMNTIKLISIGFVVGIILDIVLNYDKLTIVVPLLMVLFIILKQ